MIPAGVALLGDVKMKKYGVMLELYAGQPFSMWIYEGDGRFETTNKDEAYAVRRKYETANPKGFYDVKEIC
jgi:hypothetical protein